ncbi:hypothetical protein F503_00288 [Ophiostoma piceae UAMH 11346]|uniref:Uncharacterized protein n=1 Tax=Ophiostoma piceae (strain UAMH 11346) TaxID=1262450 RepID=S3C6P5_OPHP1|nr:hypothetical protein F503_00288 [Ophiostoma piceae UAMH 11346]
MADPETEPDVDVDELDSAAIAAAMGFSSFGSQAHPNKKRRFNPLADAVIDSPWDNRPPAARPGPPRPPTTSANSVPVRATRAPMSLPPPATLPPRPTSSLPLHPPEISTSANADEIALDDDGDDEPGPQYIDTSRPIGEVRDHGLEGGVGEPQEGEDDATFHARMQAVVAAGNAKYGVTETATASRPDPQQLDGSVLSTGQLGHRHHLAEGGRLKDRHGFRADLVPGAAVVGSGDAFDEDAPAAADGEVDTDPTAAGLSQFGTGTDGNAGQPPQQGGHGQRDWWTGYYDPSSNENPWSRLESKLELPPRKGSWLEHGHHKGQLGNGGGGGRGGYRGRGGAQNRGRSPRRY